MKKHYIFLAFLLLLSGCGNNNQDKLESFTWLETTLNHARDTSKLKALLAINIKNNFNLLTIADYTGQVGHYSFYNCSISDTLKELILRNFHGNLYPEYLKSDTVRPCIYDGFGYSIIYKYINQPERITTYIPCDLSDSIILLTEMLEEIVRKGGKRTLDTFPINEMINKYRHSIFYYSPPPPPPLENDSIVKYMPPVIIDSI
jgi:hypothetical protein